MYEPLKKKTLSIEKGQKKVSLFLEKDVKSTVNGILGKLIYEKNASCYEKAREAYDMSIKLIKIWFEDVI